MRARYYSPDLKRFINRDVVSGSIEDSQTLNHYAYVNGNPISYIDPFGLSEDPASTTFWGKVGNWVNTGLDYLQEGLDYAGFIPGVGAIPDGANAVIYTFRGDYGNAELSVVAMVPVWGDGIKAGTKITKIDNIVSKSVNKIPDKNNISLITPGSLPKEEEKALLDTLKYIDSETNPKGKLGYKWGVKFGNREGYLPSGNYREYTVKPPTGSRTRGTRRVVKNVDTGELFYTWTHYGTSGNPPFVKIR